MGEISADVDLFGDPVPAGFGKRGRPPHEATERNRNKVMLLLAMGWAPSRIAGVLGVSGPTLRKHYFFELRSRSVMLDRVKAAHVTTLFDQVKAGNVQAIKELGRLIDRVDAARFGIGADEGDDEEEAESPRRQLGKKEQAASAAKSAGEGSDWGSDLLPPGHRPN